jgi:hypothetical protein
VAERTYEQACLDFLAERECGLRAEGEFDMADMYRELSERLLATRREESAPYDVSIFDRGRTTALLKLIDTFPKDLTFYTESGDQLSENEARAIGGWLPKRDVSRG